MRLNLRDPSDLVQAKHLGTIKKESLMITQSHVILQECPRDFRTESPNILWELIESREISIIDYGLYSFYRKVAGESGACWVGTRKIAQITGLSPTTIAKSKKALSKKFALLGGKSLIHITPCDRKNQTADTITIFDIWPENHNFFQKKYTCDKRRHTSKLKKFIRVPKCDTGVYQNVTHGCDKLLHRRNNQRRNNQEELSVSEPVEKPDLVPENPISAKGSVCVESSPVAPPHMVKSITKLLFSGQSITLTKEQLYEASIKHKTDWTKEEIEEAWKVLENYSEPVREWFKFIQGTILNKRKIKKLRELQACQTSQKCPKKSEKPLLKKQPETTESKFLAEGMTMPILAGWWETYKCKKRY